MYIWMYMYLDVERAGGRAHRELLLLDGQNAGALPPPPEGAAEADRVGARQVL